jgi:hypothetical protein
VHILDGFDDADVEPLAISAPDCFHVIDTRAVSFFRAPARATKFVTDVVRRILSCKPYPARLRRQPPIQLILLLLRQAPTTNFVTHCAVSKKVVTQWRRDGPRGSSELRVADSGEAI